MVVVETVLENTRVVRVRVTVEVEYTVTCAGFWVTVRVVLLRGRVTVAAGALVVKTFVIVVVIVVEGV